jgi:hypothetical protein
MMADYKSKVVYVQKDGYVFRLKPETQPGSSLYDDLQTPVMDLRFSNSKTGDACWPIYAEQLLTNVAGEKKGIGPMLFDHKNRVQGLEYRMSNEEGTRAQADMDLEGKVYTESVIRASGDSKLASDLASSVASLQQMDNGLFATISIEVNDRTTADVKISSDLAFETASRIAAVNTLTTSVAETDIDVAAEVSERKSEVVRLDARILQEIQTRGDSVYNESVLRTAEDAKLSTRCDVLTSDLSTESKARLALKTEFDAEVLLARFEEKKLSDRIQFIVSNTDPAHIDSLAEIVASFGQSSGLLVQRVAFLEGIVQELVDRSL